MVSGLNFHIVPSVVISFASHPCGVKLNKVNNGTALVYGEDRPNMTQIYNGHLYTEPLVELSERPRLLQLGGSNPGRDTPKTLIAVSPETVLRLAGRRRYTVIVCVIRGILLYVIGLYDSCEAYKMLK